MLEVICAAVSLVGAVATVVFALCARENMEAAREWAQAARLAAVEAEAQRQSAQIQARLARTLVDRAEATYGS